MALLDMLTLTLGSAIAKALLKSWIKDKVAADLVPEVVELLRDRGADAIARRNAAHRIEMIGAQVAAQMRPMFDSEAALMSQSDREAVVREVTTTLTSVPITADLLIACNLKADRLTARLTAARADATTTLSAQQTSLYTRLLSEASRAIVDFSSQFEGISEKMMVETLQSQDRILTLLSEMRTQGDTESNSWERDYLQLVTERLDRMEQFGIPRMDQITRQQPLSVAFVALNVEQRTSERSARKMRRFGSDQLTQRAIVPERDRDSQSTSTSSPIDQVLSQSRRIVVRGEAGAGKTTLTQWVAVQAAKRSFGTQLADWNDSVPFFIRLRERIGKEFPVPEEFPGPIARNIIGQMPAGWVQRQLETGRALILVDGVDELPRDQRNVMLDHLMQLVDEFPLARYIITSRPAALNTEQWPEWSDWINQNGFIEARLMPMDLSQIETFIQHWHAALAPTISDAEDLEALEALPSNLNRLLRQRPALRRLATNPLLCSMICALHRERRAHLPAERLKLYDECVEMLLERRDTGRRIVYGSEYPDMTYGQKLALIKSFAYWMMQNDYSDVASPEADDHFDSRLLSVNMHETTGAGVRTFFVERSNLLYEPVDGIISFTHRTFQEYLAAQAALDEYSIGMLLKHARDDQWRELIIMAAGKARRKECEKLLKGLIDWGNRLRDRRNRHQLHLLAVACLETTVDISPEVRQYVLDQARPLFPPQNDDEVRLVAAAGDPAVPLLAFSASYDEDETILCVQALSLIGTDSAMSALAEYARDERYSVMQEIGRAWDSFERKEYARRVLTRTKRLAIPMFSSWEGFEYLSHLTELQIESANQPIDLQPLHQMPQLGILRLGHFFMKLQVPDLQPLAGMSNLTQLSLVNLPEVSNLAPLQKLPKLSRLVLYDLPQVRDLTPIKGLPSLGQLTLYNLPQVSDLAPLRGLPNLEQVMLYDLPQVRDLAAFRGLKNLTRLELITLPQVRDLAPLRALTRLTQIELSGLPQVRDLAPLQAATRLSQVLLVNLPQIRDVTLLRMLGQLTQLVVDSLPQVRDLSMLQALPQLTQLSLVNLPQVNEIRLTKPLADLTQLSLINLPQVRDLTLLLSMPGLAQLMLVNLPHTGDLTPLRSLPKLAQLMLVNLPQIHDLGPLAGLANLQQIELVNLLQITDLDPLEALPNLTRLTLENLLQVESLSGFNHMPGVEIIVDGKRIKEPGVVQLQQRLFDPI